MNVWRWFVGQVTRLRRSIVGAFTPDEGRADDHFAPADEPAAGPPEHWVARVRLGAPGLLEPSLRRRGEPAGPPVADRVVRSQAELELQPDSFEEPEHESVPPEPPAGPRQPEAPARARLLRKVLRQEEPEREHVPAEPPVGVGRRRAEAPARAPLVRKVLRRRPPSAVPPTAVDPSPAPTAKRIPLELHADTRQVGESAESPAGEPRSRRRPIDESEPTPPRPSTPVAGQPERSPQPTEVVEFEAPTERPAVRVAREASPDRPLKFGVAPQSAENARRAELAIEEISIEERAWERAVPAPAPRRESNADRLREPAVPRPASQRELPAEPGPSPRSRPEPLTAVDRHPWPELPPSLDQVDTDVEAALRAWDHQRRLDQEQTRL